MHELFKVLLVPMANPKVYKGFKCDRIYFLLMKITKEQAALLSLDPNLFYIVSL